MESFDDSLSFGSCCTVVVCNVRRVTPEKEIKLNGDEALKEEVSRIFSLPEVRLSEDEKRTLHLLVTAAQTGNSFRTIWSTIKDALETSHPEELANFQQARQSVGERSLEIQQSILRHALGGHEQQPPLHVIRRSDQQCASSLESKGNSNSAGSKKKRKVATQEVDTEILQLLKGVLGHLSPGALDQLKTDIGAVPLEENSENESYGSDSSKYTNILTNS
ncbi:expressed unknown protein [Seminavis robusta]|uniref:Uncharacterized protein n=1 Tax=Seminavis robusta TaxID=568900 RepID=A0A9N8HWH6_9STRA|nr:expressed unknown protein [Seminavis robusta]|eukprot:Sro2216_g319470.1 n/a (220) ;mRNA; f:15313-16056